MGKSRESSERTFLSSLRRKQEIFVELTLLQYRIYTGCNRLLMERCRIDFFIADV